MMDLRDAAAMADEIMAEHGLARDGWRWRWAKGSRVMGHCSWGLREIALYRPYASMATPEQVRNTLLHEVAHALVGRQPGAPHGAAWRRQALAIGNDGKRCGVNPYYDMVKGVDRVAAQSAAPRAASPRPDVRLGGLATVHQPNSKWHGFTGEVVTVTGKKVHIMTPSGKLMVPWSLVCEA